MKTASVLVVLACAAGAACAPLHGDLPSVMAVAETTPVASRDDAADDPAIWVNADDPAQSLILGTDKQRGIYVYDLAGHERQFVPTGAVNNVDLRQNVAIGEWEGDIAVASNRSNDTIAIYEIDAGDVRETGAMKSIENEPYGICMGVSHDSLFAFVAYKTGDLVAYRINGLTSGAPVARLKLETQLEGCVFDDDENVLYIGEEQRGIWKAAFSSDGFSTLELVDDVSGPNGLKADIEGLTIYRGKGGADYLVASSQGNNSYAVYDLASENFLTRLKIVSGDAIDGTEDTDGIDAISVSLGPDFPQGILVVQDGDNRPAGETQNFKIVDWRAVQQLIVLAKENE